MVMPIFATSASRAGIEAASDVHHYDLDEALGQLVEMSLVDATDELDLARRRYSIHPLTRAFAEAKLRGEPEALQAAYQRLAAFLQAFSKKYGGFWSEEGYTQLECELPNLLAIIRWCWENEFANLALSTFFDINDFMGVRGYWNDAMALGQQAIAIAARLGDELHVAMFRVWPVGWIYRHRGDLHSAEDQVVQALAVFERLGNERFIAHAKRQLGRIRQKQSELEQAKRLFEEALAFYRSTGDKQFIYFVTANIADVALEQGDLDTAWRLSNDVLASARQFNDLERVARSLNILGGVASQQGNLRQAKEFWEEALSNVKRVNRLDEIADALLRLAQIETASGGKQAARQMLLEVLAIYRRLDMQSRIQEAEVFLAELSESTDGGDEKLKPC